MHTIEFRNGQDRIRLIIEEATRDRLLIRMKHERFCITTDAYRSFGIALSKAFHQLKGEATLVDSSQLVDLNVSFHRTGVDIVLTIRDKEYVIRTDQSFMTDSVRQIGLWD